MLSTHCREQGKQTAQQILDKIQKNNLNNQKSLSDMLWNLLTNCRRESSWIHHGFGSRRRHRRVGFGRSSAGRKTGQRTQSTRCVRSVQERLSLRCRHKGKCCQWAKIAEALDQFLFSGFNGAYIETAMLVSKLDDEIGSAAKWNVSNIFVLAGLSKSSCSCR